MDNVKAENNLTALQWFLKLNEVCQFMSTETKGEKASNGEIRRWFNNKSIIVNFEPIGFKDLMPSVVKSVIVFPKSEKRRCTLVHDVDFTLIQLKEINVC